MTAEAQGTFSDEFLSAMGFSSADVLPAPRIPARRWVN